MEIVSRQNARLMDYKTINEIGIPSIVLMENAAEQIFNKIKNKGKRFLVVCGEGNNGGDGLALSRKLVHIGKEVDVVIIKGKKTSKEFSINYDILNNMGFKFIEITDIDEVEEKLSKNIELYDVVVDSIFGIGLNREIKGLEYKVIENINKYSKFTIAVDVPSGIDADTGEKLGIAINANETYTVESIKKGFLAYEAKEYLGDVEVVSIGIPKLIKERFSDNIHILDKSEYKKLIPIRKKCGHKGNFGKVVILAGSMSYIGASYIVMEAAIRTGSGLVTMIINDEIYPYLASRVIEGMLLKYSEKDRIDKLIKDADVIACGPGLGQDKDNFDMLKLIIENSECPMVVDADALNQISKNPKLIDKLKGRAVFTPHPGEMGRLIGKDIKEIEKDRMGVCLEYSKKNNVITLLKGYNTLISDGKEVIVNTTGSSKMASGGMGDCLTGIIASLIGQKLSIYDASILGSYVHGYIADKLGADRYSVNARDIIEEIPRTIEDILNN